MSTVAAFAIPPLPMTTMGPSLVRQPSLLRSTSSPRLHRSSCTYLRPPRSSLHLATEENSTDKTVAELLTDSKIENDDASEQTLETMQLLESNTNCNNEKKATTEVSLTNKKNNEWFQSTFSFLHMPTESILWLNAVAIVWGTQHPVIKMVVQDCDTSAFSLARFGLAALIASPYTPGLSWLFHQDKQQEQGMETSNDDQTTMKNAIVMNGKQWEPSSESIKENEPHAANRANKTAWRWGLEMGMWMFLGYAFQAIGLEYTTAQRSGFLLYLNVKFVPFLGRIFFGKQISVPTWLSAFTALVGTALLAGGNVQDLNIGDAWSIAAAVASAMFILRLESASQAVSDSAQLNAACLWVVTLLACGWSLITSGSDTMSNVLKTISTHPFELVYLGGVTTALANYMQTKAQKGISAERASVIYAMDPVYGAGFSNLLLGEVLKGWGIVGAGLITIAAATNAFLDFGNQNQDDPSEQLNKLKEN